MLHRSIADDSTMSEPIRPTNDAISDTPAI
jgi:hypothetical protein